MSKNITVVATPVNGTERIAALESIVQGYEALERDLSEAEVAEAVEAIDLLEVEKRRLADIEAREEAAAVAEAEVASKADAVVKELEVQLFEREREEAARELAKKGEGDVAAALRGKGAPAWARGVFNRFLVRFPEGKRGRFHDVIVRTLGVVEDILATEAKEAAEAERIRHEAKARYEKNRRDRAAQQSRGGKKEKKHK